MREALDGGIAKKTSLGSEKASSMRTSRSRSGSSVKSHSENERRIYVPNTPTHTTRVTGRLNAPATRGQSTPSKGRSDSATRSTRHGALAKKSPARNSTRSKSGLSLNFRKSSKSQSSLKSSKSTESTNCQASKRSTVDNVVASVSKTSKLDTLKPSAEQEKKSLNRNVPSTRRFGLGLSFRKGAKSQNDDKGSSKNESSTCESSGAMMTSYPSISSDVPWLKESLKDVMAENVSLKEQINTLKDELHVMKMTCAKNPDTFSPQMNEPHHLSSSILDETADNYSLFELSQQHDVATLHEQVNKLQAHNVTTNEELQATLEELNDLRVKSNDLRLENQSLVGEQKLLCESLCQQSERAEKFEQEMDVLKNLILSNLENPDDFQRRLAEIHRLVDLDRSSIMNQFEILKENLAETELELSESKENISRLRQDRNRWRAKYEHLKQLHAGYSSRLSSRSLSDQENRPPRTDVEPAPREVLENNALKTGSEALAALRLEKDRVVSELTSLREKVVRDRQSWDGFQADLLTAVRVAEAFRVAAEEDARRLGEENARLESELGGLRKQVEKFRRSGFGLAGPSLVSNSSVKAMVHTLEARIREYGGVIPEEVVRKGPTKNTEERKKPEDDWFQEPLSELIRNGGSRRNALLQWCQKQAFGYKGTDITNFSSSWTDGLALCALIHSYRPDLVPYDDLRVGDREKNLRLAFELLDRLGIDRCELAPEDLAFCERPEWNRVMRLVTKIFCYFESAHQPKEVEKAAARCAFYSGALSL